eukprot:2714547-Amphidinium_carterae.1
MKIEAGVDTFCYRVGSSLESFVQSFFGQLRTSATMQEGPLSSASMVSPEVPPVASEAAVIVIDMQNFCCHPRGGQWINGASPSTYYTDMLPVVTGNIKACTAKPDASNATCEELERGLHCESRCTGFLPCASLSRIPSKQRLNAVLCSRVPKLWYIVLSIFWVFK